jgi:transglutaminase-like putative cysteine protease
MKQKISLLLALVFFSAITNASGPKYAIADIPKFLMQDAKAVIRKKEVLFEVTANDRAVMKVIYAVTILNKNGIDESIFKEGYNKFSSVNKIKTSLYDQYGQPIKTGLNSSVLDVAALSGYSLYDDYRIKIFDPKYATIPFTVEFSYEITFNGLLNYPDWITYDDYNISTEKSEYTIITPKGFKFRYLEQNLKQSCKIEYINGKTNYKWIASDLPAIRSELYSPSLDEFTPRVLLAPDDFEIGGYAGNCETWTNFGLWIRDLGEKKNILSTKTQDKIKSLVAGLSTDSGKVKALYNYMQNKVRYVSVQEGIGGWQPIDAESVDRLSYGDCKALSNYMKSLLDVIGIKSYYTLVNAGENAPSLVNQFPSNQFDHAIICVPLKTDTIWLECTDQKIPFGFLGTFTDDRKVLVISETGGTVVNTRKYNLDDNSQIRNAIIEVNNEGSAESSIHTVYKGIKYYGKSIVLRMDDSDIEKYINEKIGIPGHELLKFHYTEVKSEVPSITEDLNVNIHDIGSISGKRLILKPNLLSKIDDIPVRSLQRNSPIIIRRSFYECDTITYLFKSSYKTDIKPGNFSLITPFGEYEYDYSFNNNKLVYIRSFKLLKGIFPKDKYESFVDFLEKIQVEDNKQIVLTKF